MDLNLIYQLKPESIFDAVESEFFLEYSDKNGPSLGHDYMHCKNYYELYYALGKFYQPKSICEIGVRYGYSLYSLLKGSERIENIVGYDLDQEVYGNKEWISKQLNLNIDEVSSVKVAQSQFEKFCPGVKIDIQKKNTQEIEELNQIFDMIHIDGDHSYDGKLHDLKITKQKCKILIIDDYQNFDAVRTATNKFVEDNKSIIKDHFLLSSLRGTYIIEY